MKHRVIRIMAFILSLILAPAIFSQPDACPTVVSNVIQSMDQICGATGRNQVCYGNFNIQSALYSDTSEVQFAQVGDIADVSAFQSLRLSPVNNDTNEWGVALMRLQANLPDTLPGQNVTFILFGNVQMTSAVDPNSGARPMEAFYLSSGIGMTRCNEAPDSGLLVQTPKGAGQVQFAMNGMDVSLGSTVYFSINDNRSLSVAPVEGAAALRVKDKVIPALTGTTVNLPLGDDFLVDDDFEIVAANNEFLSELPLEFLEYNYEDFDLVDPLDDESLADLLDNLENGDAICGDDTDWDCEDLPVLLGGDLCPLDEFGEPDCEAPELEWDDEGFGSYDYDELDDFFFDDSELDDFGDEVEDLGEDFGEFEDEYGDEFDEEFDEGIDQYDDGFYDYSDEYNDDGYGG